MLLNQRWVLAIFSFLAIHTGSQISLMTRHDLAVSDFYLPTATGIILINWFGPRLVLPIMYINAVLTSHMWGTPLEKWPFWFLYGLPEVSFAFLSWFLFRVVLKGKFWFPDNQNTIVFLLFGILIPAIAESFMLQGMLVLTGGQSPDTFLPYVASNLLSEFATSFFLTFPVLYYLTPWVQQTGLLHQSDMYIPEIPSVKRLADRQLLELVMIFACLLALVFFVSFKDHWYVYGFFSLYVAIRFGFGPAIVTNLYIMLLAYVFPRLGTSLISTDTFDIAYVSDIFLGANFLFVFVAITGRVISDIREADGRLIQQNRELEKTTAELDRFVYSVSHDLSAPLKSILGLVNISRLTNDLEEHRIYVNKIERSVRKLEAFIGEILDYSRSKRQIPIIEPISLPTLIEEILDNLRYTAENEHTKVHFDLKEKTLHQDSVRLKIILTNILSNALKFQRRTTDHEPFVRISSRKTTRHVILEIEDNGQGISPEEQPRIFEMFHRGNEQGGGSGLGLYIAREAAGKIGASIHMKSEYGKGSTFTVKVTDRGPFQMMSEQSVTH